MLQYEKSTVYRGSWDGMHFYVERTGDKTFHVCVLVCGCQINSSTHRTENAAKSAMDNLIMKCQERYGR